MEENTFRQRGSDSQSSRHPFSSVGIPLTYGTIWNDRKNQHFTLKQRSTISINFLGEASLIRTDPVIRSASWTPYIDGYLYMDRNIRSSVDNSQNQNQDSHAVLVHTLDPGYHFITFIPDFNDLRADLLPLPTGRYETSTSYNNPYAKWDIYVGENTESSNLGTPTEDSFITSTRTYRDDSWPTGAEIVTNWDQFQAQRLAHWHTLGFWAKHWAWPFGRP
jgi:hypothetical protein